MKITKISSVHLDSNGTRLGLNERYFLKLKWEYIKRDDQPYFLGGGTWSAPIMVELPEEATIFTGRQLEDAAYDWTMKWDAIRKR